MPERINSSLDSEGGVVAHTECLAVVSDHPVSGLLRQVETRPRPPHSMKVPDPDSRKSCDSTVIDGSDCIRIFGLVEPEARAMMKSARGEPIVCST